jgi:hypothetical protein
MSDLLADATQTRHACKLSYSRSDNQRIANPLLSVSSVCVMGIKVPASRVGNTPPAIDREGTIEEREVTRPTISRPSLMVEGLTLNSFYDLLLLAGRAGHGRRAGANTKALRAAPASTGGRAALAARLSAYA